MPLTKTLPFLLLCLPVLTWSQDALQCYDSIPGFRSYDSKMYRAGVRETNEKVMAVGDTLYSHVYYLESRAPNGAERMSHSHWTTFSFGPADSSRLAEVELELLQGQLQRFEFRPNHVSNIRSEGNRLYFNIASGQYTSIIVNGDIRNPVFIFCDPPEIHVPDTSSTDVFVVRQGSTSLEKPLTIRDIGDHKIICFETGEHFINETDTHGYTPQPENQAFFVCRNDGSRVENNRIEQIYIPGGAIVHGNIRATRATDLMVNGRGIIEGEDTYGYSSGDYFSGQILSSAVNMAAYRDRSGSTRPETMNQVVEGITSILPRKYNFQLGIGAVIKNTKCFAYHQTTDGIGVEENSLVRNNFIKVNDDALKLYQDDCLFENTYIWHQMNGAAMQLGWDKEEGDNITVRNTYLLHDDMYQAGYFNEGFWANQSIICWLKHYETFDASRDNILIDGINRENMPPVGVVRVLAIAMDGAMGGDGSGNLDLHLKDMVLGPENEQTPSYAGAAENRTTRVFFEDCSRNGICMDGNNVEARGNIPGVSIGSNHCGEPVSAQRISLDEGMEIWPNPAGDILHVSIARSWAGSRLVLGNTMGQVVYRDTLPAGDHVIDTGKAVPGLYFLILTDGEGTQMAHKVLLE